MAFLNKILRGKSTGINRIGRKFGLSPSVTQRLAAELLPVVIKGVNDFVERGGLEELKQKLQARAAKQDTNQTIRTRAKTLVKKIPLKKAATKSSKATGMLKKALPLAAVFALGALIKKR